MKKICPSILSADFSRLGDEILDVERAGADLIHCDIMDGSFVPNISFGAKVVSAVNKITELPLDVHLMINNPEKYINDFYNAGADIISVHFENNYHLNRIVSQIKTLGIKAGVVLNPATPVFMLEDILSICDLVLIMSVNPGFGGQRFIPETLKKIIHLRRMINENNFSCALEVDGGIGIDNIREVSDAGADMFVCGASIFETSDRKKTIQMLRENIV